MATYEYNGLMTVKDAAGNKYLLYPITKAECVDGLEEALATKAAATHHHAAGDVNSGVFDSARIPNLDASKIASGTMAAARLPTIAVNKGGTGKTTWSANRLIYPSASTALAQLAFPSVAGSVLRQGTSGVPYWTSLQDLVAALGDAGGVRIATGSYTGTGTYGASNPCSLTFPFSPKILIVLSEYHSYKKGANTYNTIQANIFYHPITTGLDISHGGDTAWGNKLTWSSDAISWYNNTEPDSWGTTYGLAQLNQADVTYYYMALA